VFALTITMLVLGLGAGLYAAARFLPPLAETREGAIATWTVRALVGGATAWTALALYDLIHAYVTSTQREGSMPVTIDKAEVLQTTVQSILLLDSLLIGAAGIIYLLAPTDDARDPSEA
jgi:hypothetical protein